MKIFPKLGMKFNSDGHEETEQHPFMSMASVGYTLKHTKYLCLHNTSILYCSNLFSLPVNANIRNFPGNLEA